MTGARSLGYGLGLVFLSIGAFAPTIAYAAVLSSQLDASAASAPHPGKYLIQQNVHLVTDSDWDIRRIVLHINPTDDNVLTVAKCKWADVSFPYTGGPWNGTQININYNGFWPNINVEADDTTKTCTYTSIDGSPIAHLFAGTAYDMVLSSASWTGEYMQVYGSAISASTTDKYGFFSYPWNGSVTPDGVVGNAFYMLCADTTCQDATSTPPEPTGPPSVMFLPGIEASRLYEGDGQLWEPPASAPIDNLALDANGEAVGHNIYTKDVIDEAYVSNAGPNIYKSFLSQMSSLTDQGKIAAFESIPYDWRLSLQDNINYGHEIDGKIYYSGDNRATSTPYLLQEFNHLKDASPAHKVTVIAHSNGGLLLKELLILHPELNQYIDKIIFVDVPQVGTPQALAGLLHGKEQGIPNDWAPLLLSPEKARSIANNFPSIYNLLPSQDYFTYVDDPVATFSPTTLPDYVDRYGEVIHSTDRMNAFMNDAYQKVSPDSAETNYPATTNGTMIGSAQDLHVSLDAWEPPSTAELIQIAGWGIPKTLKSIKYYKKLDCVPSADPNCLSNGDFAYDAEFTIDGDGTVVTPSQLWTSASLANVKNYWVDVDKYNYDNKRLLNYLGLANSHKDVLEIPSLVSMLSDTVQGQFTASSTYNYIQDSVPSSGNAHRLRYALHSPLTLNLYDTEGRHTGISTTTGRVEEQVPGTYYVQFGDVKYVFSTTDAAARLVMNGYATSTFTLNVDELQGNAVTASTTFKDIPVTPSTIASLSTESDVSHISPMSVTSNGITKVVQPVLNGIATMDVTPPEIQLVFSSTTRTITPTATDDSGSAFLTSTTSYPHATFFSKGIPVTSITATDPSGNVTELTYTSSGLRLNAGLLTMVPSSLSYNGVRTALQNVTANYGWSVFPNNSYLLLTSLIKNGATTTSSQYNSLTKSTLITTSSGLFSTPVYEKVPGLVVPFLSTLSGKMNVAY